MCVRFPRVLLPEGYKPSCQLFSCQGGKKEPEFSVQKLEFHSVSLPFFSIRNMTSLPLLCLLSLSPVSGRDRIVGLLHEWERRSLICVLHRISTMNFLFHDVSACPLLEVPLFLKSLLFSLAPSSLSKASTQPAQILSFSHLQSQS